jgi:hypothetical protein
MKKDPIWTVKRNELSSVGRIACRVQFSQSQLFTRNYLQLHGDWIVADAKNRRPSLGDIT